MSGIDLANAAYSAGFRGDNLVTAIAVGLAESGGNPNAECLNCAGVAEDSCGLWQINLNAHPQYTKPSIFDPVTNAAAAYVISSSGTNFSPWSTYTGGQYQSHLADAHTLAAQAPGSPSTSSPVSAALASALPNTSSSTRNLVAAAIVAGIVLALVD